MRLLLVPPTCFLTQAYQFLTMLCYYCAQPQAFSGREEHILPSSIGGNKNTVGEAPPLLVTTQVCDNCNDRASRIIDTPFAYHPTIVDLRAFVAAPNRGKLPPFRLGRLKWSRAEAVDLFLEGTFHIALVRDNAGAIYVDYYGPGSPDDPSRLQRLCRDLAGKKAVQLRAVPPASPMADVHAELSRLLTAAPTSYETERRHDDAALLREVAKIALGLSCGLWSDFIESEEARSLRYLAFDAPEESMRLPFGGRLGGDQPILAFILTPETPIEHTLRLTQRNGNAWLEGAFYGQLPFEIALENRGHYGSRLLREIWEWQVHPRAKKTVGRKLTSHR